MAGWAGERIRAQARATGKGGPGLLRTRARQLGLSLTLQNDAVTGATANARTARGSSDVGNSSDVGTRMSNSCAAHTPTDPRIKATRALAEVFLCILFLIFLLLYLLFS